MKSILIIALLTLPLASCSQSKSTEPSKHELRYANDPRCSDEWCNQVDQMIKNPEAVTPESVDDHFANSVSRWFYGPGLGVTSLNIGTIVLFPPYALYLLGNAGLQIAGYQPLYITDALPDAPREGVLTVYDTVTSAPGHITSAIAGADYYDPKEHRKISKDINNEQ